VQNENRTVMCSVIWFGLRRILGYREESLSVLKDRKEHLMCPWIYTLAEHLDSE
jgi:hypothetical protein